MSPPSSSPERGPPLPIPALRYAGPVLAVLAALAVAALAWFPAARDSPLGWWVLTNALAPERVLPLVGFGVALGLARTPIAATGILAFSLGIAGGFLSPGPILAPLASIPRAEAHLFLSGPISCVAVGAALVLGARLRWILLPLAGAIAGAMMAIAITLTDPSLHDPIVRTAGVLAAFWVIAAVSLALRAFRRDWFAIAGRIVGSWLIAIGLLYGAASLAPRPTPSLPPAVMPPPELEQAPDAGVTAPGLGQPDDGTGLGSTGLGATPDPIGRFRRP